ncbi:GlxA family transcriptional regulator [Nocardiopsis algeriensis]|uniref:Transcriptional regulator GlxA family with amidase domain n=1 Tax=Nocardiopsis algeriensis TaxID=1478215 RepID=A0A841INW8_9ACTN|nr:helix-turn-helix domain-containing protein [Nocardiopsis algeriensis]MBB6118395.1 transcriptional regulator GlxA family with amidase domain [Nocardiopsis algeriensis]
MVAFVHPGRHRVAVLARHGLLPIEAGIVHRLFGQARDAGGRLLYEVVTCALEPGEVRTDTDFTLNVTRGPEVLGEAQTVILPAADEDYGERPHDPIDPALAEALAFVRPEARVASICTGAFVLAAAGMLDGCRVTTHWKSAACFRAMYPHIDLDPDVLYTDNGRVLTAAGVASGIDLSLHMIRTDHGSAVANEVARSTVVPPHRDGGQAQYIRRPVPGPERPATARARAWALANLHLQPGLKEMAEQESMSVRTFTRRFCEEMGLSPGKWVSQQRLDRARQLLEESDLSVDLVADRSGFGTAASLRLHMHAELGVTPSAYRRTFRGTASGSPPPDA